MFKSKTCTISAPRSCPREKKFTERMVKFKMSIRLNLSTFYKHFSKTNKNTKKVNHKLTST